MDYRIGSKASTPPLNAEATAFISALTGSENTPITWQLLADGPIRPVDRRHYTFEYHLPLPEIGEELRVHNESKGCGVFYMVNQGTGEHRSRKAVTGLRALWIDDDQGRLTASDFARLPPSAVVKSKRGIHAYWFLHPGEPLGAFSGAQRALIRHFGSDPAIHDLSRLMRMPGFLHCKDPSNPFRVNIQDLRPDARFTVNEVLEAYGLRAEPTEPVFVEGAARRVARPRTYVSSGDGIDLVDILEGSDLLSWAHKSPADLRYPAWRGIGTNLATAALDGAEEALEAAKDVFLTIPKYHEGGGAYATYEKLSAWSGVLSSAETHGPATWSALVDGGVPRRLADGAPTRSPLGDARIRLASLRLEEAARALEAVELQEVVK